MDTSLSPEARADLLLAAMTLEEKVDLMTGESGPYAYFNAAIPRVGIPELRMADGAAGIGSRGWSLPETGNRATAMPFSIALGATFDPDVVRRDAAVIADEARQTGHNVLLAPNVDLVRQPWWGRAAEAISEDPIHTADGVVPYIQPVQERNVVVSLKHYNLYTQETNRSQYNAVADERTIQEVYTPPWADAVREADLGSVMCGFNRVNGVYLCENEPLLNEILREQLRFRGWVLTDFGAIHSTEPSLIAGTDMETGTRAFYDGPLLEAVRSGQISESLVDRSVLRILRTMFRFGLFDTDYTPTAIPVEAHGRVAREVEEQAITLLKNERRTLPLSSRRVRSVAVLGGDANTVAQQSGAPLVTPTYEVSPLDGIRNRVGADADVVFQEGTDPVNGAHMLPGPQAVPSSVLSPAGGTGRGIRAEYFSNLDLTGAPIETRVERQVAFDAGLLTAAPGLSASQIPPPPTGTRSVRYSGTFTAPASGPYTLSLSGFGDGRMFFDGQLLVDMTGQAGTRTETSPTLDLAAGEAHEIRVEFATTWPILPIDPGALKLGWTRPADAVPPAISEAAEAARDADVAVVVARTYESEARDRGDLALQNEQDLLISQVRAANPRTIVVLTTGGPVTMPWLDQVPAVLQAWFGGQEVGNAVARVLFGDVNPSGKLPITFPRSEDAVPPCIENPTDNPEDLDVEYCEGVNIGYRGYQANHVRPLFPFGHGLSYTTFDYSRPRVTGGRGGRPVQVTVNVRNTGPRAGAEAVQVYAGRRRISPVPVPPKQFAGSDKVNLAPGERKRVTITLDERAYSYWDSDRDRWVPRRGLLPLYVGSSSQDIRKLGVAVIR
jgi:beta-glucosidase